MHTAVSSGEERDFWDNKEALRNFYGVILRLLQPALAHKFLIVSILTPLLPSIY